MMCVRIRTMTMRGEKICKGALLGMLWMLPHLKKWQLVNKRISDRTDRVIHWEILHVRKMFRRGFKLFYIQEEDA